MSENAGTGFVKGTSEGLTGLAAMAATMVTETLASWEADRKASHTKTDYVADGRLVELANLSGDDADKTNAKLLTDLKAKVSEVTKALRASLAPGTTDKVDKSILNERVRNARGQIDASINILPEAERATYRAWLVAQGYTAAGSTDKVTRTRVASITVSGAATGKVKNFTEASNLILAQAGVKPEVNLIKAAWSQAAGKPMDSIDADATFSIDLQNGKTVTLTVVPKVGA